MPSYHDIPQGDMYIEYSVVLPTEVSETTRQSKPGTPFAGRSKTDSPELLEVFPDTVNASAHDEL